MTLPIPTCPECLTRHPDLAGDKSPCYFLCSACKAMVNYFPPYLNPTAAATLSRWLDTESGRTFTIKEGRAPVTGGLRFTLALWQDARNLSSTDQNPNWLIIRMVNSWDKHPTYSLPFDEWLQLGVGVLDGSTPID